MVREVTIIDYDRQRATAREIIIKSRKRDNRTSSPLKGTYRESTESVVEKGSLGKREDRRDVSLTSANRTFKETRSVT